jgi:tRNA pseudouridine(55) synthase
MSARNNSDLNFRFVDADIVLTDKPIGMTPFDCVRTLKSQYPRFASTKIGYAGRLDPMASGLLLLLVGDKNKSKHQMERLSKKYELQILFGISTDSGDILGLVTEVNQEDEIPDITNTNLQLKKFVGKHTMRYPMYSAKRVNGKPLYHYARQGGLAEIDVPTKEVMIYNIDKTSISQITTSEILQSVHEKMQVVRGDFRQIEIGNRWQTILTSMKPTRKFQILNITVDCQSGAYMRWLATEIGKAFDVATFAYGIRRLKVGDFEI